MPASPHKVLLMLATLLAALTTFGESEKILYNFKGGNDGGDPYQSGLVRDKSGNLYGLTSKGGKLSNCGGEGCGFAFQLSPTSGGGWKKTNIYSFSGGKDGGTPVGNLVIDAKGNLYGVTEEGGTGPCNTVLGLGCGVVFRLALSSGGKWNLTVILDFSTGNDVGAYPNAGVVFDQAGNLYGTTEFGGDFFCSCGNVYQLKPSKDGHWTVTNLYSFLGISRGGTDVSFPASDVSVDAHGNIFGTGSGGGDVNCNDGCGGVFELIPQHNGTYQEQVLNMFHGGKDGEQPMGGVTLDALGNVFGTTVAGGTSTGCNTLGCGTVFELHKSGSKYRERIIFRFTGVNGDQPVADLFLDNQNNLCSTTTGGGAFNNGIAFKLMNTSGKWTETILHGFGNGQER